jgi:ribosome-binding protein aMBF1 (putative translation factor)
VNTGSTGIRAIAFPGRPGFLSDTSDDSGACTLSASETLCPLEQPLIDIALGRVVRKQRLIQDLSQEVLAEKADVNRNHLSDLERGKHNPQASTLLKLARGLGLSCELLGAAIDEELAMPQERVRPQS